MVHDGTKGVNLTFIQGTLGVTLEHLPIDTLQDTIRTTLGITQAPMPDSSDRPN